MALFTTYYDTSRTDRKPKGRPKPTTSAMVTAGAVMSETQMLRLSKQWETTLADARIPHLHMNELPQYFAGRDDEKNVFLDAVIDLLRRRVSKTFLTVLSLDGYDEINKEFLFDEVALSPFAFCAGSCVYMADEWTKRAFQNQPRAHVHERGDLDMGTAQAFSRRHGINLNFRDAINEQQIWFAPFQPLDFLAWELRRGHEQLFGASPYPFRPSLERITQLLKCEVHNWNVEGIREKCELEGVPRRR